MPPLRTVDCTPFEIGVDDCCDGGTSLELHLWTHEPNSCPTLVRVQNFPASVWLEFPVRVDGKKKEWKQHHASDVFEALQKKLSYSGHEPVSYTFRRMKKINTFQRNKNAMILLFFESEEAMRHCINSIAKHPLQIPDIGELTFGVHEANISTFRKFFTFIDAGLSGWMRVTGEDLPVGDPRRLSREGAADFPISEILTEAKLIIPLSAEECASYQVNPRVVAMDLEVYSHNHRAFPNEYHIEDQIINCSLVYGQLGIPSTYKRYCIVQKGTAPPSNGTAIVVPDEEGIFEKYGEMISKLDPDIVTGYNIFGFDNKYFNTRLGMSGIEYPDMGRMLSKPTQHSKIRWESSGYGLNSIHLINIPGRISIDLLPLIKRDYKLHRYNLETVAGFFLGEKKNDVSARQMFEYWKELIDSEKALEECDPNDLDEIEKRYDKARDGMKTMVEYCIQDSVLVMRLFEKLNVWLSLKEMSNIMRVTITELFTRGQQLRVQSLIYHFAYKRGIFVLDKFVISNESYVGAYVFDPKIGKHDNILIFDFSSLYPTLIRENNICLSTLLTEGEERRDEEITIVDFESEVAVSKKKSSEEGQNEFFCDDDGKEEKAKKKKKITVPELKDLAKERGVRIKSTMKRADLIELLGVVEEVVVPEPPPRKHFHFEWVRKEVHYGVLPEIEDHLVNERTAVREKLEILKKDIDAREKRTDLTDDDRLKIAQDKVQCIILHQRQLALKVTANSVYGFLGNVMKAAASTVTFLGRQYIHMVENFLQKKYNAKVVYGDTDSVMVQIPGITSEQLSEWGSRLAKEISALFSAPFEIEHSGDKITISKSKYVTMPKVTELTILKNHIEALGHTTTRVTEDVLTVDNVQNAEELVARIRKDAAGMFKSPMNMEFEKAVRIILFKKKKYAALFYNSKGEFKKGRNGQYEVLLKGIMPARRDNCEWMRETYMELLLSILLDGSVAQSYELLIREVHKLLNDEIPIEKLSIVKTLGSDYKPTSNASMKMFGEEMIAQGKTVQAGDRLDYLVVVDSDGRKKIGQKMRLMQDLKSGDVLEPLDKEYYIHLLMNSIDQLFSVGHIKDIEILKNVNYLSDIFEEPVEGFKYKPRFSKKRKMVGIDAPLGMVEVMIGDTADADIDQASFINAVMSENLAVIKEHLGA
jgi:DNA polymerase elongation subunit (family B)